MNDFAEKQQQYWARQKEADMNRPSSTEQVMHLQERMLQEIRQDVMKLRMQMVDRARYDDDLRLMEQFLGIAHPKILQEFRRYAIAQRGIERAVKA